MTLSAADAQLEALGEGTAPTGGVLVNWVRPTPDGASEFDRWHVKEHIPERLGIPGFTRARRYKSHGDGNPPETLVMYDAESVDVFASDAYVERLNEPTPWTSRIVGSIETNRRMVGRVERSFGEGLAGRILVLEASEESPEGWFDLAQRVVDEGGALAARVLVHQPEVTHVKDTTREKDLIRGAVQLDSPPKVMTIFEVSAALGSGLQERLVEVPVLRSAYYDLEMCTIPNMEGEA